MSIRAISPTSFDNDYDNEYDYDVSKLKLDRFVTFLPIKSGLQALALGLVSAGDFLFGQHHPADCRL